MIAEIIWICYWVLLHFVNLLFLGDVWLISYRKMINFVKRLKLWENIATVLLCVYIYVPFFLLGMLFIYLQRLVHMMKTKTRIGYQRFGRLGIISRKSPVTDIVSISTNEDMEFLKYRAPVYLYRMSFWTAREVARWFTGNQQVELISESDLAYAIFNSVFAHSLSWVEEEDMYLLKMEGFDDFVLSKGFYWEAREIWLNKYGTKIKLVFSNGQQVSWPCPDNQINEWNLAKLHVQVCLTTYPPILSHNHVHFVFPSSVTLYAKRYLATHSFLYRLLAPHFQFSERINYQALQNSKVICEGQPQYDKNFLFWQPFPLAREQFCESVSKKCRTYYHDKYHDRAVHLQEFDQQHCNFPPFYVNDDKLHEIPYFLFLSRYYKVIRDFVASVEAFIDPTDWEKLQSAVKEHVPGFEDVDVVEGVATFMHQVAIVHCCDHDTFARFFAHRYGCMVIRTPYEPWTNQKHWSTIAKDNPEVKTAFDDPMKLIKARDIMRTRCFLNLFVDFIPDWSLDLRLISTKYDFEREGDARHAVEAFKQNLLDLDKKLSHEPSTIHISNNLRGRSLKDNNRVIYERAQNLQLVKLNDIIRTLCY